MPGQTFAGPVERLGLASEPWFFAIKEPTGSSRSGWTGRC
jgi:hypothetical protein